jgi:hypothetical protein
LPFALPSPTGTHPWTGHILPFHPSIFKCKFLIQEGVTLVFHTCIYDFLFRLIPSIPYTFSIALLLYYTIAFSALCYAIKCTTQALIVKKAQYHYTFCIVTLQKCIIICAAISNIYLIKEKKGI